MRLSRLAASLFGALVALGLIPAPAAADQPAATPRIIDGEYARHAPWAARMYALDPTVGWEETCTATVIAPTWVLTAKHCFSGFGAGFTIGGLDQYEGEWIVAGRVHYHAEADIALAQLPRPVSTPHAPLGTADAVAVGQTVQVYGWGATCTGQPEPLCQSRLLKVADVAVSSLACPDLRGGAAICATRTTGLPAGGDSGGPMFATSPADGGYYQVGVASTSDRQTRTAYTNITRYRDWIATIAGV